MARDRAGQKPLYYYHRDGHFIFGSEIKAILEHGSVGRACNTGAIDSFLTLRYVPQPDTMFEGIQVLPAAHKLRLKLRSNDLRIERYWDLQLHEGRGGYQREEAYHQEFEALFMDAVRLTMRSDVPVGAYLSGGIDSSIVVAANWASPSARSTSFEIQFAASFGRPERREAASKKSATARSEIKTSAS